MASVLEELARKAREAPTGERAMWFLSLRNYLRNTPVDVLVQDVRQMRDPSLMSYVLGAGAPQPVLDALRERYKEVTGQ